MEKHFKSGYFSYYYPRDTFYFSNKYRGDDAAYICLNEKRLYRIHMGPQNSIEYRARMSDTVYKILDYKGSVFDSTKRYFSNQKYPIKDVYEVYKQPGLKFWKTLKREIIETPEGRKSKFTRDTINFFKDIDYLFPNDNRLLLRYNYKTFRTFYLSGNIEWSNQEEFWTYWGKAKTKCNPDGKYKYAFQKYELEEIVKMRMFMFPPEKTKIAERAFRFLYRIDRDNFVYEMVLFDSIKKDSIIDRSFRVKTNIYKPFDTMEAYHYSYEPEKLTKKEKEQLTIFKTIYNLNSHIDSAQERWPKVVKIPYAKLLDELKLEEKYKVDSINFEQMHLFSYYVYHYLSGQDMWDLDLAYNDFNSKILFFDNYMGNFVSNYNQFKKDEEEMITKKLNINISNQLKKYRGVAYRISKERFFEIQEINKNKEEYKKEFSKKRRSDVEENCRY